MGQCNEQWGEDKILKSCLLAEHYLFCVLNKKGIPSLKSAVIQMQKVQTKSGGMILIPHLPNFWVLCKHNKVLLFF